MVPARLPDTLRPMQTSEWIALAAVLVAALSWLDSRRRITKASVRFTIEPDNPNELWFTLRNSGTRDLFDVRIDAASVLRHSVEFAHWREFLDVDQGAQFKIHPDSSGQFPDTIRVLYRLYPFGRTRPLNVRFPKPAAGAPTTTAPRTAPD